MSGHGVAQLEHRFQWTEPILVSNHAPHPLYTAGERVWRSDDQGMSWSAISGDLTRNDKSRQAPSGGPITKDNTGVEVYDTVFTLAESPLDKNVLWAGTDDGVVHITRDGGRKWANVTPRGLPEWSLVSLIEASPFDAGAAWAAVERHRLDDIRPYIYKTKDFGKSWTESHNGIAEGAFVHVVRADPKKKGLLFAGTELGVYVSFDDGGHWQPLRLNLPSVAVHDLMVKDDDLVVATHGRAFYILDDLAPLRQLNPQMARAQMHLYSPSATYRLHFPEDVDRRRPVGDNPPAGAIIDYYLAQKPKDEVILELLDSRGKLVKRYSSKAKPKPEQPPEWPDQERPPELIVAEAGMNRFAWNLRYEEPTPVPGAFYQGNGPQGPIVAPGAYQVRLTALGKSMTAPLEVKVDPRVRGAEAALARQLELSMKVQERIGALHAAVNQIRELRGQLQSLRRRLADEPKGGELLAAAIDLDKRITVIERELICVDMKSSEGNLNFPTTLNEKFDSFTRVVESADTAPTRQMNDMFARLSRELDVQLGRWKDLAATQLPQLDAAIRKAALPVLEVR
jgi:hypothetical protein